MEAEQPQHWTSHKAACRSASKPAATASGTTPFKINGEPIRQMDGNTFMSNLTSPLANLSKPETYRRLIDSYRFRKEDEYTQSGDASGLYGGEDPLPDFLDFMRQAVRRKVVPDWWTKADMKAISTFADGEDEWANINHAVEKSDIQEHYDNPMMPMSLRILAEKALGSSARGF
ncbi:hypothetical protein P7C70_g8239, partial [Phenoliferia sp. Uapishka_3]